MKTPQEIITFQAIQLGWVIPFDKKKSFKSFDLTWVVLLDHLIKVIF
jgi:hypothetical protein